MKFRIGFTTDNAAFFDEVTEKRTHDEVVRLLRQVADRLESGELSGDVRDINGNKVGTYGYMGGA